MIPGTGYLPEHWSLEKWEALRKREPDEVAISARESIANHVQAILSSRRWAFPASTTATTSARRRRTRVKNAFDFPGFVPAYIRPLFCRGKGPFRWVALSGEPEDIYADRRQRCEMLFPGDRPPAPMARSWRAKANQVPGPARAHLLARPRRAPHRGARVQRHGARRAIVKAPIVIGRDHLDAGSVASPNRETEAMRDGLGRRLRLGVPERAAQLLRAARPGCRSITAAASAWGTRSTRGWSSSATAQRRRRSASSACCGTIRRPA